MNKNYSSEVYNLKKIWSILFAAMVVLMASAMTVCAEDEEDDESDEGEEGAVGIAPSEEANGEEEGEGGEGGDGGEKENSTPGFELAFAAAGALGAARLAKVRLN